MYDAAIPPARQGRHTGAMEFVVVVRYKARAGESGRVEAALRNMLAPSRAEPGNLVYEVLRDAADPSVFVLYERYTDEAAFEAHRSSAHFSKWLKGDVLPCLEERTPFFGVPLGS
jgi:quinol monooxygenase YgiN